MKLAAARAGAWFFGTIIFVLLFMSDKFKDTSTAETIGTLAFYGFIAGGAAFFWTWHQVVEDERRLEMAERRKKALNRDDSGTTQ